MEVTFVGSWLLKLHFAYLWCRRWMMNCSLISEVKWLMVRLIDGCEYRLLILDYFDERCFLRKVKLKWMKFSFEKSKENFYILKIFSSIEDFINCVQLMNLKIEKSIMLSGMNEVNSWLRLDYWFETIW